jgi:hypothetical protein
MVRNAALALLVLAGTSAGIGELRIAGFTPNDQQVYGPSLVRIINDAPAGVHVVWKDALANAAYNFFDLGANSWRWPDGTGVFDRRASLGNIALSPARRELNVSGSFLEDGVYHAICAYDTLPGSGDFSTEENTTSYEYEWTLLALTANGWRHFAALRHDSAVFTRGGSSTYLGRVGYFPSHNIAASRTTSYLSVFWTKNEDPNTGALYLRRSTNNGYGWRDTAVPTRSLPDPAHNTFLGASGEYDDANRLHIVCNTYDGSNRNASALWHFGENDTPNWSRIHSCSAGQPAGALPAQALIAGRPSIGEEPASGDLFVVWEQFDPANVEPATGVLRSDIWAARSEDQGRTWAQAIRLTDPDNTSKRYPNLARAVDENLHITYLIDSIAGFSAQGQGRATQNPIAYLRVPAALIPTAIAEPAASNEARTTSIELQLAPNPAAGPVTIECSFGRWELAPTMPYAPAILHIANAAGRLIRTFPLPEGEKGTRCGIVSPFPSRQSLVWDGTDSSGRLVKRGIYFCRLQSVGTAVVRKLVRL